MGLGSDLVPGLAGRWEMRVEGSVSQGEKSQLGNGSIGVSGLLTLAGVLPGGVDLGVEKGESK